MPGRKVSEAVRREQILGAAHHVALRDGIDGVTVRAVAARARVSHGLVLFHFRRKEQLVTALLDRVLASTLSLTAPQDHPGQDPRERLTAVLRQEVERLSADPAQVRLFLEYWALGSRRKAVGERIRADLRSYREVLGRLAADMLLADPTAFGGGTPERLASVCASFVHGCVLQALIDPGHFDAEGHRLALRGLLGLAPVPATQKPGGPRGDPGDMPAPRHHTGMSSSSSRSA